MENEEWGAFGAFEEGKENEPEGDGDAWADGFGDFEEGTSDKPGDANTSADMDRQLRDFMNEESEDTAKSESHGKKQSSKISSQVGQSNRSIDKELRDFIDEDESDEGDVPAKKFTKEQLLNESSDDGS